jgi:hypothetical protein
MCVLVLVFASLLNGDVDVLGDDERVGVGAIVGNESSTPLQMAVAVVEVLVEAAFPFLAGGQVVVVPFVVTPDPPHG